MQKNNPITQEQSAENTAQANAPQQVEPTNTAQQVEPVAGAPTPVVNQAQPAAGVNYLPYVPVPREPYVFAPIDVIFALVIAVLGYFAVRYAYDYSGWVGFKVTLHTFSFAAMVLALAFVKKIKPLKESWYWLTIILINALSYSAWPDGSMAAWRFLLMMCLCIYWPATVFGGLLEERTGNIFLLDIINIVFCVPFQNYFGFVKIFAARFSKKNRPIESTEEGKKNKETRKRIISIFIGVAISLPLLLIIVPMLVEADSSGGFTAIFKEISKFFKDIFNSIFGDRLLRTFIEVVFAVPLVFYIFGLIYGFVQKRYIKNIDAKKTRKSLLSVRILAQSTVVTVLVIVSALYALFLFSQAQYLFAAFSGKLASGYQLHSSYARDGFFELCRIVALNLFILLAANIFCKVQRSESKVLKIFNIVLALATILLIFTAFSKMMLYISVHGLTIKRVQVCAFLLFLFCVWGGVIAMQFFKFSIMRVSLVIGSAILCVLCVCNVDMHITNYNRQRLEDNTIQTKDDNGEKIYNVGDVIVSSPNGVWDIDALIWYYENIDELVDDENAHMEWERESVARRMYYIMYSNMRSAGTWGDTVMGMQFREKYGRQIIEILDRHDIDYEEERAEWLASGYI